MLATNQKQYYMDVWRGIFAAFLGWSDKDTDEWALSAGRIRRPLRLSSFAINYEERMDLEHSLSILEPLLFLLGRVLSGLCDRLRRQSMAARLLSAKFRLEDQKGPRRQCTKALAARAMTLKLR